VGAPASTAARIPLADLVAQYRTIQPEIDDAIRAVLEDGRFIHGPNTNAFESEMAAYVGVPHAVGVASGTDAIILALRALGIGAGDEVIVPSFTFVATASAVLHVGASPVLVDVEPDSYGVAIDRIERAITKNTRAIIAVHLFGQPVDMSRLLNLSAAHHLDVIEDNAQALGAMDGGHRTGSIGRVGCLSFFPSKNLGGYGDGGMVVTSDADVAARVRMLRTHGWRTKYEPEMLGYNSRLDEMQAAVLRVKLRHLDEWNAERARRARRYASLLSHAPVRVPGDRPGATHVHHLYVVGVPERAAVQKALGRVGVDTAVYYPVPLHRTTLFRNQAPGDFPVSDRLSEELLAIPLYPEMSDAQQDCVVAALDEAVHPPR
jgi:dTDP-4-amino-4,6-dideoxygalactose transaminase